MAFELGNFNDPELSSEYVTYLIDQKSPGTIEHYGKLWDYFRNPLTPAAAVAANATNASSRPYFQAQEAGLPPRITGIQRNLAAGEQMTDLRRKEVVIENEIAWRIHTMVDFLFGKPPAIRSLAADANLADTIEQVITAMLEANGGIAMFQEFAMLGAVYGFVDIALRIPADISVHSMPLTSGYLPTAAAGQSRPGTSNDNSDAARNAPEDTGRTLSRARSETEVNRAVATARILSLETIEAPRVLPILEEDDYRQTRYWVQCYHKHPARLADRKRPWYNFGVGSRSGDTQAMVEVVEIVGQNWWQRYEDRLLVAEGPNILGRLPLVHIQNVSLPGTYAGLSDVEPLIPLQDELNTRLSDRAHRVTYQSFKMYLGKGIDDFLDRPVGPGQMWATQNPDANIEEFGSDSGSPSEASHIEDVRLALDKVSGVPPLASGILNGNVGNLTSATALKVVLSGLLARTAKKRLTYGVGIQQIVELALAWLDVAGVLKTRPEDRRIEIHWPNSLPVDETEQLRNAQIKVQLGVPGERILAELGYDRQANEQNNA